MYCSKCGFGFDDNTHVSFCPMCGQAVNKSVYTNNNDNKDISEERKDWLTTLLLCIFVGQIGIHRFYTGHIATGIVFIFTIGGCGIWWLIDLIRIATGDFKDANGKKLVKK